MNDRVSRSSALFLAGALVALAACGPEVAPAPEAEAVAVVELAATASCAAGLVACKGACVNLLSDAGNCGTCGRRCGGGQSCVSGCCAACNAGSCGTGNACFRCPADRKQACFQACAPFASPPAPACTRLVFRPPDPCEGITCR